VFKHSYLEIIISPNIFSELIELTAKPTSGAFKRKIRGISFEKDYLCV